LQEKFLVAILIVNKMATPQGNLFPTDYELRMYGFTDQVTLDQEDISHNDYATGGSERN
jgi:hypothetical protein